MFQSRGSFLFHVSNGKKERKAHDKVFEQSWLTSTPHFTDIAVFACQTGGSIMSSEGRDMDIAGELEKLSSLKLD